MFRRIYTVVFLVLIKTCLLAQVSFNFYPNPLKVELKKTNLQEVVLKELAISAENARSIRLGKFFEVTDPVTISLVKYVYVGRVNTCRAGGCSISQDPTENKDSEFFDYFIFYNASKAVHTVKIYNYQATHGQEITSVNWLKQFRNYDGKQELYAGKNIDGISGATISVDALVFDVELKTKLLKSITK